MDDINHNGYYAELHHLEDQVKAQQVYIDSITAALKYFMLSSMDTGFCRADLPEEHAAVCDAIYAKIHKVGKQYKSNDT